jgi:hypothetical protein
MAAYDQPLVRKSVLFLRFIDVETLRVSDSPVRLDHDLALGLSMTWVDDHRVALNGRIDPAEGEGLWIASLGEDGAIDWSRGLAAAPSSAYVLQSTGAGGRLLAMSEAASTSILRVEGGRATNLTSSVDVASWSQLNLGPGGHLFVTTPLGPGWVSTSNGAFSPSGITHNEIMTLDGAGRPIAVVDGFVTSYDEHGVATRGLAVPTSRIECNRTGTCVVMAVGYRQVRLWKVDASGLGPERDLPGFHIQHALSPDGRHVAVTGDAAQVQVMDLETGAIDRWRMPGTDCEYSTVTHAAAWLSDRVLFAAMNCHYAGTRVYRLAANEPPKLLLETAGTITAIAPIADESFYALMHGSDAQPVIIDGL